MTDRLYAADASLLVFPATVTEISSLGDRPALVLDRTAFYPEGGGQPADHGTLGGVPVVDVQEVDGRILHAVDGAPPTGAVEGRVDGARRLDHLQQHHGQHLLSAAFEAALGAATRSFHLGTATCTIDLALPAGRLDERALRAVEARANQLVTRDLAVEARELSPAELQALPLRTAPVKGARVVVVRDEATGEVVDASPCGGTHPRRTGAVGAIALLGVAKWGDGARVEFVCGARALAALATARGALERAAAALRCAPAEVAEAAARGAEALAEQRKTLERLTLALAGQEAERLAAAASGVIGAVLAPPGPGAAGYLRAVASGLTARGRTALLGAVEDGRALLCFSRPRGPGPALGDLLREAAAGLGGKGGGSPDLAQGGGPDAAKLEAVMAQATARLSG